MIKRCLTMHKKMLNNSDSNNPTIKETKKLTTENYDLPIATYLSLNR